MDIPHYNNDIYFSQESLDLCDRGLSYQTQDFKPRAEEVDRYFDMSVSYQNMEWKDDNLINERLWLTKMQEEIKVEFKNAVQELLMLSSFANERVKKTEPQLLLDKKKQSKRSQRKPVSRFYNKNICRYIENHAISTLVTEIHQEDVMKICDYHKVDYSDFRDYYLHNKCKMQGVQLLKSHLKLQPTDSTLDINRKKTFQSYLVWYLDNLATRHIITRLNKSDVREYLKYKNYVMTYFVRCPDAAHVGNELPDWVKRN